MSIVRPQQRHAPKREEDNCFLPVAIVAAFTHCAAPVTAAPSLPLLIAGKRAAFGGEEGREVLHNFVGYFKGAFDAAFMPYLLFTC